MTTSDNGIALIKKYEGLRLTAYKAKTSEHYYTIGWGHYGQDVRAGQTITKAQAEGYLLDDITKCEKCVDALPYNLTQNQFDALVSFTFNCGAKNLLSLTDNGNRPLYIVAEKLLLYTKAGGVFMAGLKKRREAEHKLFISDCISAKDPAQDVKDLQRFLNEHGFHLTVDGIAGPKTKAALNNFLACAGVKVG